MLKKVRVEIASCKNTIVIILLSLGLIGCATVSKIDIEELIEQASGGDPEAQFNVGAWYDNAQDPIRAFDWYMKAAKFGYAPAQNALGSMYQFGQGVTRNEKEAFSWYAKSAKQGNLAAIGNMAYMFDEGVGVKSNKKKAFELYLQTAHKGMYQSMLNLGVLYWSGEGTSKDVVQAWAWLDLARFLTQSIRNTNDYYRSLYWKARSARDGVRREMTHEQYLMAKKLSRETLEKIKSTIQLQSEVQ